MIWGLNPPQYPVVYIEACTVSEFIYLFLSICSGDHNEVGGPYVLPLVGIRPARTHATEIDSNTLYTMLVA